MPLLEASQRSDAWYAARAGRITASLAAACLGCDPYRGPLSAWREIMGISRQKENRAMRWGTQHEAEARQAYEAETGNLVVETGFWVHPIYDWLGASPDGLIGADGLLETKCPGTVPHTIPAHHKIQVEVQLAVTEREWADYFAWCGADRHYLRSSARDRLQEIGLLAALEKFYTDHILTKQPPKRRRKETS